MRWAPLAFLALFGSIGGYFYYIFTCRPELSHKTGWSVLEGFESQERRAPFASPAIKKTRDGRYVAISILGVGEPKGGQTVPPQMLPGKAWILLNEHAADKTVLILPEFVSYRVSCETVGRLPNSVPDVDGYVLKYLSAICH